MEYQNLPPEIKELKNWVLWKLVQKPDKPKADKIPFQINGQMASSTNPEHWCTFNEVIHQFNEGGYNGIGFVFEKSNGITGIDLDNCFVDGKLHHEAEKIVKHFNSFTEYSQSGKGLHIFIFGNKPEGAKCKIKLKDFEVEVYDHGRYFALTGRIYQ